ncbi:MAG: glutamine--fructose-6-phosphate transaminase (isomerizing) [Parcubacteria group bacterium]|nr:glutamine--fructose-6-phosphate transaminase (isomerizing) [Parcubacteria group bacterium]
MCGIVGYIGKQSALPIILDGLKRLEYRGYDSGGIAILDEDASYQKKVVGRIRDLEQAVQEDLRSGKLKGQTTLGIGHTRWATHGTPTTANAHPHTDCHSRIFLVHNGIIENHAFIRSALEREGHRFSSQTDTEVLAHLIEQHFSGEPGTTLEHAIAQTAHHIKGTFGIAVFALDDPDKIVVARRGSPLLIGVGEGEYIIASDASAIIKHTKQVVYLHDNEIGILKPDGYTITTLDREPVERAIDQIEWDIEESQKDGFPHFMLKEIFEAPQVIENSSRGRLLLEEGNAKLGGIEAVADKLRAVRRIIIAACGTSYYAALIGRYMLEEYAGIPVVVEHASEFRYHKPIFQEGDALLVVSQSGETADTLEALREAKAKGVLTLGIVNVVGSTIARETDAGIYNHAGPEIAVASTKAFVSQLTVLTLLSLWLGRQHNLSFVFGTRIAKELALLPQKAARVLALEPAIAAIAKTYADTEHFLYLGRKYNWPAAMEGALKLKEISYIHAEGYPAGEMKHGPIALINERCPSFVLAPSDSVYEKVLSNIEEIRARGGRVIAIGTEGDRRLASLADDCIFIPRTLEMLSPLLTALPLYLFAYHIAVLRGCDVDKPRNLAKSVTVE